MPEMSDLTLLRLYVPPGTSVAPTICFTSEHSLGFFRSGTSTIANSYGTVDLSASIVKMGVMRMSSNTSVGVGLAAIGASAPAGLALISAANCWISFVTPDGSTVWVPGWK
jgi:hypothetical protein